MNATDKIRKSYDRRPYPHGNGKALKSHPWQRDLIQWISTLSKSRRQKFSPRHILVAGCGAGTEAFGLARRFPDATVVAVDFSRRSIALARRLQKQDRCLREIRFITADLSDPDFPMKSGRDYDLVWCHGVLSYIPDQTPALTNLRACMAHEGVLYLGVNGSSHPATKLRPVLTTLGLDVSTFQDGPDAREILKLCDTCLHFSFAKMNPEYLQGDIFGAFILSQSLRKWIQACLRAGLHLVASHNGFRAFSRTVNSGSEKLMPLARTEVAALLDDLAPSSFHRLLFSRNTELNPPWENEKELAEWRMGRTDLYQTMRLSPRQRADRKLKMKSPQLNLLVELDMSEVGLQLFRKSDGTRSMRDILGTSRPLSSKDLRKQFYDFYQLGVINLLPPFSGLKSNDAGGENGKAIR